MRQKNITELTKLIESRGIMSGVDDIARLSAETTLALVEAVETLQQQIPVSVADLKVGLDQSVNKIITANDKLASSNDKNAKVMVKLTYALVFVGIMQAFATLLQVIL